MAIRGSKKNRNAIKVHIFPHTQLAAFVLEKWVFSSRSWLFHGSRSVPSANASCKRRMANGKAENGQSNKCSANFHVQGDKTKRNKTKRTLEPKASAHRLASFPFGFRVYVCVCVALLLLLFSVSGLLQFQPGHFMLYLSSLLHSTLMGGKMSGRKARQRPPQSYVFSPSRVSAMHCGPLYRCHPDWQRPKKKRFNASSNAEFGIGLGARASDTLCQPSAYGQIQYVHLHTTIYIHRWQQGKR